MRRRREYEFLIYASNVTGLGATQVAGSLVEALVDRISPHKVALVAPAKATWTHGIAPRSHLKIINYRRILPHRVSRLREVLYNNTNDLRAAHIINLGDLPLKIRGQQIVLVHQPHLISPEVDGYSSKDLSFRTMRCLMRLNGKYADTIIVQTDVFKRHFAESYPDLADRVVAIPQPAPSWLPAKAYASRARRFEGRKLTLFYPAAGYPHKNHELISKLAECDNFRENVKKVITTRSTHSWISKATEPFIDNRGRLSPQEMAEAYQEADALFFPSLSESYGLPILEAMLLGLPVICSDRPFARWICDAHADFFDPERTDSALAAINSAHSKLKRNHWPDWSKALSKFPDDWDQVADDFLRCFH